MKFLSYILRNARRNPIRSLLTVGSIAVCLLLMMILLSFLSINDEVFNSVRIYNRIVVMNTQGFAQPVPIALVGQVQAMDGVVAASPLLYYGGKYGEETLPFAQFGVDADTIFTIYDEMTIPPDQLRAFQEDRAGCVIGRKLAESRNLNLGDPLPIRGDLYPVDLNLVVSGIYDGPSNRDLYTAFFHWAYLDEALQRDQQGQGAGNAAFIVIKCANGEVMAPLCQAIDEAMLNSDTPTRTQTEEAFGKMFMEMWGDMRTFIQNVGLAVVFSLFCVASNTMAMALRERTTEIAVLKAIGFGKALVIGLVLAEAILIAGTGGVIGALGSKMFFDLVDVAPYTGGALPFFFVPWHTALIGLATSLAIGLVSGIFPAYRAMQLSVVDGLRKVV